MAIIKRKTRKKIGKQVRRLVRKHGPEIALGAASALVSAIITKATEEPPKKGKKRRKGKSRSKAQAAGPAAP